LSSNNCWHNKTSICFSCQYFFGFFFSGSERLPDLNWIDLTHPYDRTTLYWPNNIKGFEHVKVAEGITAAGYYYSSYSICTPEHGGTHLDAPIHFAENKLTVDQLPLSSLTGNAVVIDVFRKALVNRDYQISIEDIENWENENNSNPNSLIVKQPLILPFHRCILRMVTI
jgi:kynurenine formamidase